MRKGRYLAPFVAIVVVVSLFAALAFGERGLLRASPVLPLPSPVPASLLAVTVSSASSHAFCPQSCRATIPGNPPAAAPAVTRVPAPSPTPLPSVSPPEPMISATTDAPLRGTIPTIGPPPAIAQTESGTLPLYLLTNVRADQKALLQPYGVVQDRGADTEMLTAKKLPLHVGALTAAGIHVEKVPPTCGTSVPLSPTDTLREITQIGASNDTPLGDRQYDGPGTVMAAEYLYCRFAALGFTLYYDTFPDGGGRLQENIVALPPGRSYGPDLTLVTGHYDTLSPPHQSAPGADDNGSGLTAMLDLATRVAGEGFVHPVGFVAFAAEEPGLLGSTTFAARLAGAGAQLRAVINLDAIGIPANGRVYVNGDRRSRDLYLGLVARTTDAYTYLWMTNPNDLSDDESFRRNGYVAVMVTTHPFGTEPLHHTDRDRIENVDLPLVKDITDVVWQWIVQPQ